ncbi:MAG: hypothetical protein R3F37_01195 [Candidatus Competibacteraceae bacterium]
MALIKGLTAIRYKRRMVLAIIAIVLLLLTLWRTAEWAERTGLENLYERAQHDLSLFIADCTANSPMPIAATFIGGGRCCGVFELLADVNRVNRHLNHQRHY